MTFRSTSAEEPSPQNAAEAAQMAAEAGLIYVSCQEPGIRRLRARSRFYYLTPRNRRLSSARTLRRIASLAVPPAYKDVWICVDPRGHLQATGQDARGRKQYRYHPQWREVRDNAKFDRMVDFGKALARLRRTLKRDLSLPGLPRAKVLAAVVTLLDTTRARIGNVEYARDNKSFGLTTLRNRHVAFPSPHEAVLSFRGKSGINHELRVEDQRIVDVLRQCYELPGRSLFQYLDPDGRRRTVDSVQVNDYLREAMNDEFTAKEFRTWGATLHALMLLRGVPRVATASERALKGLIAEVVKQVAAGLGNTPAVCRKSYINPLVFNEWRSGFLHEICGTAKSARSTRKTEMLLLKFLDGCRERGRRNPAAIAPSAG
jgi:DNA topoisomerase-1